MLPRYNKSALGHREDEEVAASSQLVTVRDFVKNIKNTTKSI